MKITVKTQSLEQIRDRAAITFIYEDDKALQHALEKSPLNKNGVIASFFANTSVKGKLSSIHEIYLDTNIQRLVIVGLGKKKSCTLESIRRASATVGRYLRDREIKQFSIDTTSLPFLPQDLGQAL